MTRLWLTRCTDRISAPISNSPTAYRRRSRLSWTSSSLTSSNDVSDVMSLAQEVGVLLDHRDVDAAAGGHQAQHYSRRAAAGDDAGGPLGGVRAGRHSVIFASNSLAGWAGSSTGGTASNCGYPACRSSPRPPW